MESNYVSGLYKNKHTRVDVVTSKMVLQGMFHLSKHFILSKETRQHSLLFSVNAALHIRFPVKIR